MQEADRCPQCRAEAHHHSTPTSPPASRLDLLKAWPLGSRRYPRPTPSEAPGACGCSPGICILASSPRGLNAGSRVSPTALDHTFTSIARQTTPSPKKVLLGPQLQGHPSCIWPSLNPQVPQGPVLSWATAFPYLSASQRQSLLQL